MAKTTTGGYPKRMPDGRLAITDWAGKVLGYGSAKCTKVGPHERGAWISNERCSYRFEIDGKMYHGRGRGDGISVALRPMALTKRARPALRGTGKRR